MTNGPGAPAAPLSPPSGRTVGLRPTVAHLAAVLIGAALVIVSVAHVGVHGAVPQTGGMAAGALTVAGATMKYLDTHDKAAAGVIQREIAWGQAHATQIEGMFGELKSVENVLPENLAQRLEAIEGHVSTFISRGEQLPDVGALIEQVKAAAVPAVLQSLAGTAQAAADSAGPAAAAVGADPPDGPSTPG